MSIEYLKNDTSININKSIDVDYKLLFENLRRDYKNLENQYDDILMELIELKRNK